MKNIKLQIFKLSFLILTLLAISSCKDDDSGQVLGGEDHIITGYDHLLDKCQGQNYVLNNEGTECICPENTHYRLNPIPGSDDMVTYCMKLDEGYYLYNADIKTCLYEVRDSSLADEGFVNIYDGIGMAIFDFESESLSLWIDNGGYGERYTSSIFGAGLIGEEQPGITHFDDGSFSVLYNGLGNWEGHCLDWKERSPGCSHYEVLVKGRSTPDRSKIDLELSWTNCHGELLDVGSIEMWKEW